MTLFDRRGQANYSIGLEVKYTRSTQFPIELNRAIKGMADTGIMLIKSGNAMIASIALTMLK